MSIQVGTTNLTNYRTYSDQLYLTTTSNSPLIHLDSTHASQNVFMRTGNYFVGQSNTNFYIGLSNTRPILQYHDSSSNLVVSCNILASNVQATFRRVTALEKIDTSSIVGSNLSITYDASAGATAMAIFRNSNSNVCVINGYDDISYFAGRLGVGTTLPSAGVALETPSAIARDLRLETLSFTTTPGVYLSNVAGSIHLTKPSVFEGSLDVVGALSAGSFDIADLSTNRGVFRSNVVINDYLLVSHTSNQAPSVTIRRNYPSSNAAMFSNVAALQPLFAAELRTNSNTDTLTTRVLTIDPTGKIGIGTTTPSKTIDIYPSARYTNTVSNTGLVGIHGTYATDFISINSNAFIGIGTDSPTCYVDMMLPSTEAYMSNSAPGYLYVHSNTTPYLFMDSNGHIGIHTTTTRPNAAVYIDGVLETEYLSAHRFITPDDSSIINFSQCNLGNISNVDASNVFATIVRASNIYCDLMVASNYDLLAFNSYRATKEFELELDDFIYTGKNMFIIARDYPLYFDVIGASNAQGGLDGTTDSNLEHKPTDHYILPEFGKIHIVCDTTCNTVVLNDGRQYNNAIVATSSNQFVGFDCNTSVFLHTEGSNGAGYSFGLSQPNLTNNDAKCRLSLDPYPYNDTLTPITTYGYETVTMALEPYAIGGTRRIGYRYNYTQNTIQFPKIYVAGASLPSTIDASILTAMTGHTVYTRGNVKAEATSGAATLYNARYTGAVGNELTFAIGSNIDGPTGYYLDVNGKGMVRNDFQVIGKIYANSVISQTSDRRLKDHLEVIGDPLTKINQLTGYTFDRTDLPATREAGLIAQDVQRVLPEVVHQNSEGYYSIAYGNLAGLFVESIKSLEARVRHLEAALAAQNSL